MQFETVSETSSALTPFRNCKFGLCLVASVHHQEQLRSSMPRGPMRSVTVLIMVVACLPNSCAARIPELDEQLGESGFRHLLAAAARKPAQKTDPSTDCTNKFPKLNYTPVTSVCKPKVAATRACCVTFNKFACQFQSQVNNFNTICPILFMSYLNYAGGYQDGYFIGKCINGKKGLCV